MAEEHGPVLDVYKAVKSLPREETYALGDQIRRAAVSIPSNIAEGCARDSAKDFAHFLLISLGSAAELETQVILCKRLGYIDNDQSEVLLSQLSLISKMLRALVIKLRASQTP